MKRERPTTKDERREGLSSVEFFRNPNIDFLSKKWYFIAFSLLFSVAGIISMAHRWAPTGDLLPLGIDFRGGTLVYVKYSHAPDDNAVRAAMDRAGLHNVRIQRFGTVGSNEILIDLPLQETSEQALDRGKNQIISALQTNVPAGKPDLNNTSALSLADHLMKKDPLHLGTDAQQRYSATAQAIVNYRDKTKGGVLSSFDELKGVAEPAA